MPNANNEPSMAPFYRAREDAERGSGLLNDAMRAQFETFALKHGVTVRDAGLLLMNGEGL